MNTVQFKINSLVDLQWCDMTRCFAHEYRNILYSFKRSNHSLKTPVVFNNKLSC